MNTWPPLEAGQVHLLPEGIGLWVERAGGGVFSSSSSPSSSSSSSPPSLSPREEAFFQTLPHPRRRLEWKQSRLMAKMLLSKIFLSKTFFSKTFFSKTPSSPPPPEAFELLPQEEGPPLLLYEGKPLQGGRLSVSHTASYVGVAFAPFAVGLDICDEADAPRIARIAHRAFLEDEAALCESPQHFAALWALKEAALKMQGGGVFRPGLSSVRVARLFPPTLAFPRVELRLHVLEEAFVALAF